MPKSLPYREQEKIENTQRLRELLKELPPLCQRLFPGQGTIHFR